MLAETEVIEVPKVTDYVTFKVLHQFLPFLFINNNIHFCRVLVNDMMDHNEQQERLLEDEESPEEERDEESGFGRENLHAANQTTMG